MLGGDAAWLLEGVPKKVAMLEQHASAPLASLAVGLGLDTPTLPPEQGLG
jgi:hypothetical protein